MKKVCLVNPPQFNSLDDRIDPPLGLMYIASYLEKHKVPVTICDLAGKERKDWHALIDDADIYGMTVFSSSLNVSRDIARHIKNKNNYAKIVVGGPHPTSLPNETIAYPEFDHVIVREGEEKMLELVRNADRGIPNDKILYALQIKNVNVLPLPARHLLDMNSYSREVEGQKATSIVTARGCPFDCSFCCKDIHGRKVRFRSEESILEEIDSVKENYGISSFIFYDDIFTLNRSRLKRLTDAFKARDITFRCNGHAGTNTYEDYVALKEAGCREISFGIESGSDYILKQVNKGTTAKMNYDTIVTAKRAGLLTKAFLVVGFPGETQETIDDTKRFMDKADPDKFTLFQFVPLPGCDVYRNPAKYGVTSMNKDWDQFFNIAGQYEGGHAFETAELTAERSKYLHDDLLKYLLRRKGNDHGQHGTLQGYYRQLKK
jgi:radical SAM superfamily enzyme YgiQ (UPF0313 family)